MPSGRDLLLEERAIATKGDLFEDIYGVKVRLEESMKTETWATTIVVTLGRRAR